MPRVYMISDNTTAMRFHFTSTFREAKAMKKELVAEHESEDFTTEIDKLDFPGTADGIAQAMNYVIHMTGFNEG